ncbi:tetratricopeptide repeat protein 22-like [Haliotis rufescens]|uniref:tetratricopeptide repeat protein 22-like n=1 Tax=Haliotis rufescens TaxID=6454 RepID=UPI001EAFDC6B|nr:tetratricopeptide repeat protein 22-like [Haliotis rufescens]
MIPDTQPGTLSLTLKIGAQEKYLKYRTNIVEGILKETEFKNLKLAALNTLGAFKFHQGEFLEASGYFQRVLDEDPGNINARANLHHVHLSLKSPSGRQFDDHLKKANDAGGTEEDMARRLARCLAEQAFAVRGTCAATFADTDGFFRSNELYSRALSLVEDLPFEREFGGWKILMITNLRNICRNWDRLEQTSQTIKEYYQEAVDLTCSLYETVRGKKEYALLEGHALVHLGYFLSKKFRNIDNSQWNLKSKLQAKDTNLSWEYEDHLECFKRAMTLAPSSTKVINMYARSMSLYLNGDMHTSLELLEQSIGIDPSPVNWFARFERADIRRRQYLADKRAWEDSGSVPDRGLLLKAVEDYLFIIKCTPCPYYTCELAMVYCEIAMNYKQTEETQANEYTMKSLECFQQALFTLDGRQLPHIHYFHGLCLKNFGELRYAIEAFKRSVESHSKGSKKTGCLEHLLDSLCKEYIHNGDRDQSHSILSEMTFWVIFAFDKYDAERLKLALEACAIKEPLAFTDMTINIAIAEKAFSVGEICSDICLRLGKATSASYYAQRMRETCSVMKDSQQFVLSTRAPTARNKCGFKYDFVIIYSDGDRPWVLYSLLLKLEQEFSFKGFVDDRDAIPGKSHLHNFEYALENSYKALLILSPDFLDNAWCNHEMQTAITRMLNQKQSNTVLPIKIKECETPDTLNCIKPFQAFDSVQWERLLEAIQ